jgi:hypothetical protein
MSSVHSIVLRKPWRANHNIEAEGNREESKTSCLSVGIVTRFKLRHHRTIKCAACQQAGWLVIGGGALTGWARPRADDGQSRVGDPTIQTGRQSQSAAARVLNEKC